MIFGTNVFIQPENQNNLLSIERMLFTRACARAYETHTKPFSNYRLELS